MICETRTAQRCDLLCVAVFCVGLVGVENLVSFDGKATRKSNRVLQGVWSSFQVQVLEITTFRVMTSRLVIHIGDS